MKKTNTIFINILISLGSLVFSCLIAELYLRYEGIYKSYSEKTGVDYAYVYGQPTSTWRTRKANSVENYHGPEFHMEIRTNSEGIRDDEHPIDKKPEEVRIVAIGDSFSEGAGATLNETWFKVLERSLQKQFPSKIIRSISGSVSGNDPIFARKFLNDKLLKYKPDIVIFAVNESDFLDVATRGGEERFLPNEQIFHSIPYYRERIYAKSFLARLIMHRLLGYTWLMVTNEEQQEMNDKAMVTIAETLKKVHDEGVRDNYKVMIALHPGLSDIQINKRISRMLDVMDPQICTVDMTDEFIKQIKARGEKGLDVYFWPIDNHYTPKGYELMAEMIEDKILENGWIQ